MDRATVDELLTTTRAVRRRLDLDRAVEPEVILECLDLALQAPTGGNSQGWRWLLVTDPDKRAAVADAYRKAWGPYIATGERLPESDPRFAAQERMIASATFLADNLHRVPVHVIPCALGRLRDGAPTFEAAGFYGSIIPAVWSFQLALRSRGLGSAYTTLHLPYEDEVAAALGIPPTVTQVCLLPVAYTVGDRFRPGPRKPAREVAYWDTWRNAR